MNDRTKPPSSSSLPLTAALTLANAIALAVFMTGFLLTRVELPKYSKCSEPPASFEFMTEFAVKYDFSAEYQMMLKKWEAAGKPYLEGSQSTSYGCWNVRRFEKAVMIVIDALRFDFTHADVDEPENKANGNFRNHLRLLDELHLSQPEHAKLFVFEADPPTTTMQRLKGIVTGGMPTFIDFSSNFDSSAITEDNILFQMSSIGLKLVMMGDDTWIKLFPNTFSRAYPYPSFNVKDLHTVDNGVIANLLPEIDTGHFNLLIGHFLGVDHVGHRFYANHPTMKDKLMQFNEVLKNLVSTIDDNTILFVLGDHGMTPEGNHGGTTKQETNAALFVFSKQKIFPQSIAGHNHPLFKQVDLVPTISLLLGSPIPYSSLGTVMTDLFTANTADPWKRACGALRINAWQVQRYLHDYSATSNIFEPELMQHLTAEFLTVDYDYVQLAIQLQSEQFDAELVYKDLAKRYELVLSRSQSMCREKWTMFDLPCMVFGMLLLILVGVGIGCGLGLEPMTYKHSYIKFVLMSTLVSPLIWLLSGVSLIISISVSVSLGLISHTISSSLDFPRRILQFPNSNVIVAVIMIIPYFCGLVSNSVVITESSVVNYYSTSICLLLTLFDLRNSSADFRRIIIGCLLSCICLRLMGDGASFGPGAMLTDEFFSFWQLLQTFGSLFLLVLIGISYSRSVHRGALSLSFKFMLLMYFCIISVYWYLDASVSLDQHASWHFLPQIVYALSCILALATIVLRQRIGRQHCLNWLLTAVVAPNLLLLGPKSPWVILMTILVIYSRYYRLPRLHVFKHSDIPECMFFWMLGIRFYFATGHSNTFSSLQVSSAFVGFEDFEYYRSGAMLLLNTFGGFVICGLGLAIVSPDYTAQQVPPLHKSDYRQKGYAFERPAMIIIFFHAIRSAVSTLTVLVHRRHLMVWDVFAPKFVFDAISMAVVAFIMFGIALLNKIIASCVEHVAPDNVLGTVDVCIELQTMSKDSDKILSSLPLQIALYFNKLLLYLYFTLSTIGFIYKRHRLLYPDSIFGYEIASLILLFIVDYCRMALATKGNLMQQVTPMLISLLLTGCAFVGYLYFLRWQTYILNVEHFLNIASLSFISFEFLFGLGAAAKFAQQRSV